MTDTDTGRGEEYTSFMDQSGNFEYVAENFDIYEFLMEYEKRPELWDKNHQYYRNKLIRLESEEGLCNKLQIPDLKALRRKIRSVRGSYNAVIGKVRESLQNGGEMYVTKLSWFPIADRFLRVTTDIPGHVEIPMEIRLNNEPVSDKRPSFKSIVKPKTQYIIADTRSLAKSTEVLIEDGTYSYEEVETTYNVDKTDDDDNTNNFKIDNIANPEYIIAGNENPGETITEEFVELDSSSNTSENEANTHNNTNAKKQKRDRSYIVQNQVRNYRLDNCKPYDAKNRLHNTTKHAAHAEEKESGMDNILNYLKNIASERENEFVAFGKSIGVQLSTLPIELAIQLQGDIQRHITKVRMNYLKENENENDENDENDADSVESACDE